MTMRLCDSCWGIDDETRHVILYPDGRQGMKHHVCCAGDGCDVCALAVALEEVR